ncbi:hypothetical protein LR48_Vigan07g176900 [Vigna angularis]|uniref:Uncharacterized protein n=1 Tax=Phaseolus angularis TaxID=3914 RepID=A0A0L9UYY5_PHAAN|nr:hypothetical protein LR48_Vigan07g176900 [Vigna angularis]
MASSSQPSRGSKGKETTVIMMQDERCNNDGKERITAHLLAWVILLVIMMQDVMTTEDVCLLHAIKNDIPTNRVEVLKDHMAEAALSNSHYLSYVVLISKLLIYKLNNEEKTVLLMRIL